jgi:hypothetical protein
MLSLEVVLVWRLGWAYEEESLPKLADALSNLWTSPLSDLREVSP